MCSDRTARALLPVAGSPGGGIPCALALQRCQLSANHTSVFPQVCKQRTSAASLAAFDTTGCSEAVLCGAPVILTCVQGLNDTFREMYKRPGQDVKQGLHTWQLVAAGGSAGAVQGTLTYPLDLIKTRLALAKDSAYRFRTWLDIAARSK
jgi:hypothetical protein